MTLDRFDEVMVLVFSIWFLAQGFLFAMIWQTSRISMIGRERTLLSKAQHDLAFGLVIVFFSIGTAYAFRWLAGPVDGARWATPPFRISVRVLLVVGLVIETWAGVRVAGALLERLGEFRQIDEVEETVNVRQDARENSQNKEDHNLEIRRTQQDQRENRQDQRDRDQQGQ